MFESFEYRIFAVETKDKLNIENPQYIHTHDPTVVDALINVSGDIVITSLKQGNTTVYVGDTGGLSNSARIHLSVDSSGKFIEINIHEFDSRSVKAIIKQSVNITGTSGSNIIPKEIILMMDNTHFIVDEDMDVSSWITNLPPGLNAIISFIQGGPHPHEVYIEVSGIPSVLSSDIIKIIIPGVNAGSGWDVFVENNPNAKFNIE
jgi:hypothetical protein